MLKNIRSLLHCVSESNSSNIYKRILLNRVCLSFHNFHLTRTKKDDSTNFSALFKPVPIKTTQDDINIGAELTGILDKAELIKILNRFSQKREIRALCVDNGLDSEYSGPHSINLTNNKIFFRCFTTTGFCELSSLLYRC